MNDRFNQLMVTKIDDNENQIVISIPPLFADFMQNVRIYLNSGSTRLYRRKTSTDFETRFPVDTTLPIEFYRAVAIYKGAGLLYHFNAEPLLVFHILYSTSAHISVTIDICTVTSSKTASRTNPWSFCYTICIGKNDDCVCLVSHCNDYSSFQCCDLNETRNSKLSIFQFLRGCHCGVRGTERSSGRGFNSNRSW